MAESDNQGGARAAGPRLSALVVARNEAERIGPCLERLTFADEVVVLLDRSTDRTADLARARGARVIEGDWALEAERRNAGIAACTGEWILEVDADEWATPALGLEIRPALLQLAQDHPEEAAVHPAGNASAAAGVERVGLGVFDVVGHLVEEGVEEFLERTAAELAVVGVDPHQRPGLVVAAEHPGGRAGVDVDLVGDEAAVDLVEPRAE